MDNVSGSYLAIASKNSSEPNNGVQSVNIMNNLKFTTEHASGYGVFSDYIFHGFSRSSTATLPAPPENA
jgi:hypothetical protein